MPIFLPVMTIPFKMSHTVWEKHSTGKRAPGNRPRVSHRENVWAEPVEGKRAISKEKTGWRIKRYLGNINDRTESAPKENQPMGRQKRIILRRQSRLFSLAPHLRRSSFFRPHRQHRLGQRKGCGRNLKSRGGTVTFEKIEVWLLPAPTLSLQRVKLVRLRRVNPLSPRLLCFGCGSPAGTSGRLSRDPPGAARGPHPDCRTRKARVRPRPA